MNEVIFIIEDDSEMADCLELDARCAGFNQIYRFEEVISAIEATNSVLPAVILLDVLLTGPNGFTLLNELASYSDTAKIPIVLISSLDFENRDLRHYNVIKCFNKATMLPGELINTLSSIRSLAYAS